MWARISEFLIALWLILSPWILETQYIIHMLSILFGVLIVVSTAFSFSHLRGTVRGAPFGIGMLVVLVGWFHGQFAVETATLVHQNLVMCGLLLLMFGIIPHHTSRPPSEWRNFKPE